MKIESVRIENFRCFKDELIFISDYTCFVGPNGAGKSTVLNALNVFFHQNKDCKTDLSKLSEEDYHHKNTDLPVKITITFTGLSLEAMEELKDYVRQDQLIVSSIAKFDKSLGYGEVKQYGSRMGIDEFRKFFAKANDGEKVGDLKDIYLDLQNVFPELPKPGSKQVMIDSLRDYESKNHDKCILISSEDQFYGISKGVNRLSKYVQWVFISASKDYTEECEESKVSALGQLLSRTVRSKVNFAQRVQKLKEETQTAYQAILDSEQNVLKDISQSLGKRLADWSHPGISAQVIWKQDTDKSVKVEEPWAYIKLCEKGFEGDLARFGHGLQRSFLLALLQELSLVEDESSPTLIMGIEEPEIYQHPPQAKYLSEILQELSQKDSQILVCSHSPLFIPGDNFESIRIVREKNIPPTSFISSLKYADLAKTLTESGEKAIKELGILAKLYPSLNPITNEMFFCKKLILTEGVEDIAYIATYLMLSGKMVEFRRNGCHIVPVGGKSELVKPIAIANLLQIPVFVVCDADTDKDQIPTESKRNMEVAQHKKDNRTILNLCGQEKESEWPKKNLYLSNLTMWSTHIDKTIDDELGEPWKVHKETSFSYYQQPGGLNKNPLSIARALESSWNSNLKSAELLRLIESIISFANNVDIKN